MLQETFYALADEYHLPAKPLWDKLTAHYNEPGRYYHTLHHLENMLAELQPVSAMLENEHAVLFALYYHDVIYDAQKKDNEVRSAALALKTLHTLPPALVARCEQHILATRQHAWQADMDTNYFMDADLSILGQPWEVYATYAAYVRKEYHMYPDLLYKPGRKKVLQHFLDMERIFKTAYFHGKYETAAKANLQRELAG